MALTNLKQFLPSDVRIVEILSGLCFVLIASLNLIMGPQFGMTETMNSYHAVSFWVFIFGFVGAFQLYLIVSIGPEVFRAIISWISGSMWIWLGVSEIIHDSAHITGVVMIMLGIVCNYASVIYLMIVRTKWS